MTMTWRDQLPLRFKTPVKDTGPLTPYGTVPPIHAMTFRDPIAERSWLEATQARDIASMADEAAANGMSTISLSSSPLGADDDDMTFDAVIGPKDPVPFDPDPIELATRQRRYDWEQFILHCSSSARLYVRRSEAGSPELACSDRRWSRERILGYIGPIRALVQGRTLDDLDNDRARAEHYGAVVMSTMSPEEQAAWMGRHRPIPHDLPEENINLAFRVKEYLFAADDNASRDKERPLADPEEATGGPYELGLHFDDTPYEPMEWDLWPTALNVDD
jgi:hypothetical protein